MEGKVKKVENRISRDCVDVPSEPGCDFDEGCENSGSEFSSDCEGNRFWMRRAMSLNESITTSSQIAMQKDRLRRAKLLSGYYLLQSNSLEEAQPPQATEEKTSFSIGQKKEEISAEIKKRRRSFHLDDYMIAYIHEKIAESVTKIGKTWNFRSLTSTDPRRLKMKIDANLGNLTSS